MTKRANVLTVSLIAIFAATGVRAEIASKAYVDQQVDSKVNIAQGAGNADKVLITNATSGDVETTAFIHGTGGSYTAGGKDNDKYVPSVKLVETIVLDAAGESVALHQGDGTGGDPDNKNKAMITDNTGQVVPGQIATGMIANKAVTNDKLSDAVNASLDLADSAVQSVTTGDSGVGTIKVDGTSVTVHGLGTAAGANVSTNGVGATETGLVTGQQVQTAISNLGTASGNTYQVKSTGASIGGANGTWTALTDAQLAAMNSGATTTNIGKIATNESAIATLNGDATTTGSVAKSIADAISDLDLANTYDAKGSAATAKSEAIAAAATDATSKANAAEAAAKAYTDTATTNMQVTTNLITDLDANKTATDKYPSAKTVYDAVEAAKTAASGAYQPKSTADRQIGTTGGLWRALTANEAAALDSGITTAKVSGYDSTKSAVENATTGLAATKAIADSAKTTAEAALPAATYNTQVGTVSAANMGTSATTVVGAIKEVSDAIDDLDTTYAKDSDVTSGLALKQDTTDSTATAGNYIAAGTGVGANLGALDTQLKTTTDTANAAIPKPSGNCTDCVLHFNGTAYAWEEVGR